MTPLLVLCGPTAAGKTALALEVARQIGAEIVSADSMQVYRGLDVGTAKPSLAERDFVPHHLLDIAEVEEPFSAGRFRDEADQAIRKIRARGAVPFICGGTMLYLRGLLRGLIETPADTALRDELEHESSAALWKRLQKADPQSAQRLHPNDRVRIVRALELTLVTGAPASQLREEHGFRGARYRARIVALVPARPVLRSRIDDRIDRMLHDGLLEETRWLVERARGQVLPPLRALGYRQLAEFLSGSRSWHEAMAQIRARTRAFARRQMTWIRSEPDVTITDSVSQARDLLLRFHSSEH